MQPGLGMCAVGLVSALTGYSDRAPCAGTESSNTVVAERSSRQRSLAPDCGIQYKIGPYVVCGRITVNAKKPTMSSISATSSHSSNKSQVFDWLFARLNLVGPAVCPVVGSAVGPFESCWPSCLQLDLVGPPVCPAICPAHSCWPGCRPGCRPGCWPGC